VLVVGIHLSANMQNSWLIDVYPGFVRTDKL
jgi:hypothetical protein